MDLSVLIASHNLLLKPKVDRVLSGSPRREANPSVRRHPKRVLRMSSALRCR
jgi:hypothetical protein